ncbi:MAG: PEP-CTERM sorting domain-containing protein [Verrucomicrobiales bacterium]|nr:PEP-CTERM sorting domain-containing protein [Verrucomicrobiales bacterium]
MLTLTAVVGVHAQWLDSSPSDSNYNDPANWVSGTINDQFVPVSGSTYGWTASYKVTFSGTRELPGDFVYNNADNVDFTLEPINGSVWKFSSASPKIQILMGPDNTGKNFTFGAASRIFALDLAGKDLTFEIDTLIRAGAAVDKPEQWQIGGGRDIINSYAELLNVKNLNKTGVGRLRLYKASAVSGDVNVSGGWLDVNAAITGANNINVSGQGVFFELLASNTTDLLDAATKINLYSGGFNLAASASQSVGDMTLYGGHALLGNTTNAAATKTLTLNSLDRKNFATLSLNGYGYGTTVIGIGNGNNFIKVTNDANLLGALVGGGGAAGSTTISVIPWAGSMMSGDNELGNTDNSRWAVTDLVTYTTAGGFRRLLDNEYQAYNGNNTVATELGGFTAYDNVSLNNSGTGNVAESNNALWILAAGDHTMNALRLGVNGDVNRYGVTSALTMTDGQKLTIASGAIIGNTLNVSGTGVISSGTNPFIFQGRSSFSNASTVTLTNDVDDVTDPNAVGFIAANVGSGLILSGSNSWRGMTVVQGNLSLSTNGIASRHVLPNSTELRLDRGGLLALNHAYGHVRKLSGTGEVRIESWGSGGLTVGAGATEATGRTVIVGNGGILAPGDLSGDYQAGTLLVGSSFLDFIIDSDALLEWDIAGDTVSDQLQKLNAATGITGALTVNGGTLALNYLDGYTPIAGEEDTTFTWTLATGFASVSGDAANLTISDALHPDWVLNENGYGYSLLFDNNNLILTLTLEAVPEPSTWLLLATGAGLLALLRRRR